MKKEVRYTLYLFAIISALLSLQLFVIKSGFSPYGMNKSLFGFDNIVSYRTDGRFVKTAKISASAEGYDVYMLGSSRLRDGLDPTTVEAITGLSAFNYGVSGLLAKEMTLIVDHLLTYKQPKIILIGLDFFAFNDAVSPSSSMALHRTLVLEDWLKLYLSSFALKSSRKMWDAETDNIQVFCAQNGFCHDERFSPEEVAHYIRAGIKKMGEKNDVLYDFYSYDDSLKAFSHMLEKLEQADVKVLFFHSPAHITYYKRLMEIGLLDDYLKWKKLVSGMIIDKGFGVWDANTMNPGTSATLAGAYVYFTDYIHYTKYYGDSILADVLSNGAEEGVLTKKLTSQSLAGHIEKQRRMALSLQYESYGF